RQRVEKSRVALTRGKMRLQRHPGIDAGGKHAARREDGEAGWQDTGDAIRTSVELNRSPDDTRIRAEPPAPERVAQENHQVRAHTIVFVVEGPAECGVHAE